MENLKLTFPSPHPGTHLLVETRLEKFSYWLESLPSGNMPRYVSEIADAITNINRTELPIKTRMRLVQKIDIAYGKIHHFYRPLMKSGPYKGKLAPDSELKELYRLTRELSYAYKIAVYAYFDNAPLFGKHKKLANAINMSLHYLGLVLLEQYELYAPIPMHIWREIHQLYYTAERKGLSEIKNKNNIFQDCFDDVETTYLRIALIALANPYHLKRGYHWEIFIYLSQWANKAIISEDPEDFSQNNCFVLDLAGNDKPIWTKELSTNPKCIYRFILTKKLNKKISRHLDDIEATDKSPRDGFSQNIVAASATRLLKDMQVNWETKQERKTPRYDNINRMEVIWGLMNIHKVISAADPLLANSDEAQLEECHKLIEQNWDTLNSGDGGLCISQSTVRVKNIDVGHLVAIRNSTSADKINSWKLGVVCWLTGDKRMGTQVGIQYLKGDIQVAQLQARKGSEIDNRSQLALLLSGENIEGSQAPTILTTSGLYVEARPMLLSIGEELQYIHARKKVSSSGSLDRFFYQLADQHIKSAMIQKPRTKEPEEKDENTEEAEVINLSAMPMSHAEDFEVKVKKKKVITLDDMIVSKNK